MHLELECAPCFFEKWKNAMGGPRLETNNTFDVRCIFCHSSLLFRGASIRSPKWHGCNHFGQPACPDLPGVQNFESVGHAKWSVGGPILKGHWMKYCAVWNVCCLAWFGSIWIIRNKRGYICWTWLRKSLLPAVPNPKGPKAQGLTSPELFPSSFLILKLYGIFFKLFFKLFW